MPQDPYDALAPFGWSDRVLALFNELAGELDDPSAEPARVVRVESSAAVAVMADGTERLVRARSLPAVGDWAAITGDALAGVVPRWSELSRQDPGGQRVQVLAANVDLVVITAPADRLSPARVERELALAWESGAQPLVALTKADLAEPATIDGLADRLVGVDLIATSAAGGAGSAGVEELRRRLRPERTAVLLGPSGAGKSTLANALVGADRLAVGEVRAGDRRGRHTTTARQLVTVPGGGVLIDTPGLRSLGLSGGDGAVDAVDQAFPEIDELAGGCRFGDCRHESEPGCAVTAAVAGGMLAGERLASYRKLQRELAAEARRTDPLARQQAERVGKARAKQIRAHYRNRPR